MSDHIWIITDNTMGDASYIQQGLQKGDPDYRIIGPFCYTSKEDVAETVNSQGFLPPGVTGDFSFTGVDATAFIQLIDEGFPPSDTDVFVLDGAPLPLTQKGAEWVDDSTGEPNWVPLFEGADKTWLAQILGYVAECLGKDDGLPTTEQSNRLIKQHVRVAIIPEPGTIPLGGDDEHCYVSSAAKFWIHTRGMSTFGLPELEIRDIPCWWVTAAGAELSGWATYSLDQGMSLGDVLEGGGPVPLEIRVVASDDPFWKEQSQGCLRLEVIRAIITPNHQEHDPSEVTQVH